MTLKNVIFERVLEVVLSRVRTLKKLDLNNRTELSTNINLLLLKFRFKLIINN